MLRGRARNNGDFHDSKLMQLELGLKKQVRAGHRNSKGPLKTYSVQCDTGEAKLFLIIHELSVPSQSTVREQFQTQPQQIPYDARPSLAVAAVTRNVAFL
jgi:hypothetical protein